MTHDPALFRRVYNNSAILWLIYSLFGLGLGLAGGGPPALAQSQPQEDQILLVTLQGQAMFGGRAYTCSLGRAGVRQEKREGNHMVKLPYPSSHERMWRDDDLYDLVVVGYNDQPVIPGRGSAIFLHLARPGYAPTAGCVGLAREDLLDLLARLGPGARVGHPGPGRPMTALRRLTRPRGCATHT